MIESIEKAKAAYLMDTDQWTRSIILDFGGGRRQETKTVRQSETEKQIIEMIESKMVEVEKGADDPESLLRVWVR